GLGSRQLAWMFTTFHLGPYQPLSWMTLGLDYVLFDMKPAGYHATNILLHSVAAALLAAVVFRLMALGRHAADLSELPPASLSHLSSGAAGPVVIALLWSLHPLRVEAVAWITERREVLCGALSLLAVLLHLQQRRPLWIWLAGGAAMLAKGSAMVLPV